MLRPDNSIFKWKAMNHTIERPEDGSPPRTRCVVELESPGRKRMRFLFDAGGEYRALMWAQVASDGSLMFAPRQESQVSSGRAQATDGRLHVNFEEATPLEVADRMGRKISIHASGEIKAFGQYSSRGSLRDMAEQERLAMVVFSQPLKFDVISEPDKEDYLVPGPDEPDRNPLPFHIEAGGGGLLLGPVVPSFPLHPSKPLLAAVYASPLGKEAAPIEPDMTDHMTILQMPVTGLKDGCQDLTFQWVFGYGIETGWPTQTAVIWTAERIKPDLEGEST